MKTAIHFYFKEGKKDIEIISLREDSTPNSYQFQKGDKFWFSVDRYYPRTISDLKKDFRPDFVDDIVKANEEKDAKFGLNLFKIISIYRSMKENPNQKNSDCKYELTIEYTCKKVKIIRWKFWQTYKFKQFFKNIFNK